MRYPLTALALSAGLAIPAFAQKFSQWNDLYPAGHPGARLGSRLAADGDLLAAVGNNSVLYTFDLASGSNAQTQRFTPGTSGTPGGLGTAMDMDGSTLAVSAEPSGAVALFTHNGTSWTFDPDLVLHAGDAFGRDVSLGDDWLAVGAPGDATFGFASGAVYLYQNVGTDWVLRQVLHDPAGTAGGYFGSTVSLDEGNLAVGAPFAPAGGAGWAGHVVFFELDVATATWAPVTTVISQAPRWSGFFGTALDLEVTPSGMRVAIGEPGRQSVGNPHDGYVEVWDRQFGFWVSTARLHGVLQNERYLGLDVVLRGDRLLTSARTHFPTSLGGLSGVGVVFALSPGGVWEFQKELVPSGNRQAFEGAADVAIAGDRFLVGAPGRNFPSARTGAVHVFMEHDYSYDSVGFGDLASGSCPCMNATETRREEGCMNSRGFGGHLVGSGSDSRSANDFELIGRAITPNSLSLLFSGSALLPTQVGQGDGSRATGGNLLRLGFTASDSGGEFRMPNLMQTWGWPVGQTIILQVWYRDPPGPCASGYNVTNSVRLTVQP